MKHDLATIQNMLNAAVGVPWAEGVDASMREQLVRRGFKYRIAPLNEPFRAEVTPVTLASAFFMPDPLLEAMSSDGDVASSIVKTLSTYVGIDLASLFMDGNVQSADDLLVLMNALSWDTHYRLDCTSLTVSEVKEGEEGWPDKSGIVARIDLVLWTQPF